MDITYADLRDDDVLIDKSGGRWHVSGVDHTGRSDGDVTDFWLGDARTKVRVHHMTKPAGDPCTVDRVATLADTVAELEKGWPKPDPSMPLTAQEDATWSTTTSGTSTDVHGLKGAMSSTGDATSSEHDAAVAAVEQGMPGARVEADSTAAEVDAAARATDDDPVILPLFESMTPLEQRSHLFVLHGVFADDLDDAKTLAETHFAATRDRAQPKLRSLYKPHEHSAEVK